MSVTSEGDRDRRVTLAFELAAIERFTHPAAVIEDAGEWSRYVGLIANDTDAVAAFVREHGLRQDFDLGSRDKWLALSDLHEATDTPRHVFVGLTGEDERAAAFTGWEFVPVAEAAEKADWTLEEPNADGPGSLVTLLRDRLPDDLPWPLDWR